MSEEFQTEIEAGMRDAFQLGFEKGRADLLSALTLIQSIAVPLPATNVLEKSFDEGAHPRDDNGRFVSKDKISAAAKDPDKAAELRKTVTDPEQRKKLDAAIDKKGKEKVDDEEEVDNNKQAKKKGDSEKVTKIRKTATMRKTDSGSLAAAVRSSGGIDPKSLDFLKFHTGVNEAMEYGIPLSVFRKGGMGLDILAAQLHENGIINTPEGKDHAEHLLEKLAEKAKSDLADNTKEIEEAYHEHARNEYLASLEHSPDEVASATRLGQEAGKVEEDPDSVTYRSGNAGEFSGGSGDALPETAGTDFEFGANEGTGSQQASKPAKPKRRTVEQTVTALERIGKRAKLRATDLAIIHEAINGHTHAEIAEVKKRLGIKASGAKAKQAADIANRILERDRSDSRKFNHPHLTVDEAKAHVDKFIANTEPKPGDAVRLANALAGGLTTKQLLEIKKHYGIKASGAKSEMALKIAKKLAPTVANDWSEQDAKLNKEEPAKPDISSHATAYQQAKQLIATPGKAVGGVRMKQDVIGLVAKQQGVDYDTAEAMLEDHGKQPESVKADATAPKTALDLTTDNVQSTWEKFRDEIINHDPKLSPNAAGSIAAARIMNNLDDESQEFRKGIDERMRKGEAISDDDDMKYGAVGDLRKQLYHKLVTLSGYRPGADVENHPLAKRSFSDKSLDAAKRSLFATSDGFGGQNIENESTDSPHPFEPSGIEAPAVATAPGVSHEDIPKQTPKLDLFGNPIPKTWPSKKADQLSIEDQLKTAWVDHAHDFAAELGHKVNKIHAGGQFEVNGKRYRVGLADEGYPIHDDTTNEIVRNGQTSGPVTNVKPESKPVDLESKLKGIFSDYLKQSSGKTLRSEGNPIAGNAPISDASRDTRDNAERSHRVATGTADESDIVAQLGGPHATKSQLATRLAKFGMPEKDVMGWIDTLKPTGKAKTGTKQNTYDTLDVAKRLGIHQPKQEAAPEQKQPETAPVRRTMAYEGQSRPEHARFENEQSLTAEHATNPQHWDALAEAGKRDWLIQEAKRRGVGDEAKKMPARKIVELLRKKQG